MERKGRFLVLFVLLLSLWLSMPLNAQIRPQSSVGSEAIAVRSQRWSFLTLEIVPGYNRIRVDHEQLLGFSDKILLPVGNHWIQVIAPSGYLDTSFKITLMENENMFMQVRLRDVKTGKLASPSLVQAQARQQISWKPLVQTGSFVLSGSMALWALRENSLANQAYKNHTKETDRNNKLSANAWYDSYNEHSRWRDLMAVLSIVGAGAGIYLCFVF